MVSLPSSVLGTMHWSIRSEQRFQSVGMTPPVWCRIWKVWGSGGNMLWEDTKWLHHWLRWELHHQPLTRPFYIMSFSKEMHFLLCHSIGVIWGPTVSSHWSCTYRVYMCRCIWRSQTLWLSISNDLILSAFQAQSLQCGVIFCSFSVYCNTSKP